MKKWMNYLFYAVIAFLFFSKVPSIIQNFSLEKRAFKNNLPIYVKDTNFSETQSLSSKKVVVFWATWCPPCKIELDKLNQMILDKKISYNSVHAISIENDFELVKNHILKSNYLFTWSLDKEGEMARNYQISSTPTLMLVNNDVIEYVTNGVTPTLGIRLAEFFKN